MSTINLGVLKSTTANPPTMQSQNGIDRGKFCRAWVSFGRRLGDANQYEVLSQFNTLAVEDTGVGTYTITFQNALPSNRCAFAGAATMMNEIIAVVINAGNGETPPITTTTVNIRTCKANVQNFDAQYISLFAYGDQ